MCLQSLSLYARTCAFNRPPIGGPIRVRVRVRVSVRVRVRVGVCVCPTLDKEFSTTISPQAGGRSAIASLLPTKTLAIGSETRPDPSGVPAFNTLTPLVHPAAVRCFHGPSCYHPQAHCSLTADLQPR